MLYFIKISFLIIGCGMMAENAIQNRNSFFLVIMLQHLSKDV